MPLQRPIKKTRKAALSKHPKPRAKTRSGVSIPQGRPVSWRSEDQACVLAGAAAGVELEPGGPWGSPGQSPVLASTLPPPGRCPVLPASALLLDPAGPAPDSLRPCCCPFSFSTSSAAGPPPEAQLPGTWRARSGDRGLSTWGRRVRAPWWV